MLNRALHARRIAAADPYAGEVALRHALVTRVGYGTGEQVADGALDGGARAAARAPRGSRASRRCGRRSASPPCWRRATPRWPASCSPCARGSTSSTGRDREATLQLEAALGAALAELEGWRELDGMPERLEELRSLAAGVEAAAAAARAGALDEAGARPWSSTRSGGSRRRCGRGRRALRSDAGGGAPAHVTAGIEGGPGVPVALA